VPSSFTKSGFPMHEDKGNVIHHSSATVTTLDVLYMYLYRPSPSTAAIHSFLQPIRHSRKGYPSCLTHAHCNLKFHFCLFVLCFSFLCFCSIVLSLSVLTTDITHPFICFVSPHLFILHYHPRTQYIIS